MKLNSGGIFVAVYDHYGGSYKLADLMFGKDTKGAGGEAVKAVSPIPLSCGYFDLYLEEVD